MKKFITYFLIFALSLTSAPVTAFAQDIGGEPVMYFKDKKGRIQEYKPAMSFNYDNYEFGQISPYTYVEKLEQVLSDFDIVGKVVEINIGHWSMTCL